MSSTFNQAGLNDLVCHLGLSKVNSELLVSRLKEKNALAPDTNITFPSTREQACWCALMKKKLVMAISFTARHSRTLRTHECQRVFTW